MRKVISLLIIVLGIVADQLMKAWVMLHIPENGEKKLIPGIFALTHETNNGAAWSSLQGQQWFFLILTPIVLVIAIIFLWRKIKQNWYLVGLSLIIAGALGNFIDRVRLGYVVDMFETLFVNFPIFNVADSLLTVGFICLLVAILHEN
ncbi:MAG: signal peptidase II [Streptococcaceae bacterium]|jgi:signal peptidase II|nr:signal peptidase II [Streptococcaceae bacterium]